MTIGKITAPAPLLRPAQGPDASAVRHLYEAVKGTRFCIWNESYPTDFEIGNDLAAGNLFVLEQQGQLIGAISVNAENEMDDLSCWKNRQTAAEFSRVVIGPAWQGRGLSRLLVSGILQELRQRGAGAVHISVAKSNIPAQRLYEGFGFLRRGEADMYGSSFFLMELPL